jgi:hypothetical protein
MGGACNAHSEKFIQGFCGEKKSGGNRPLGKKYSTWQDNIKLDMKEIERKVVDWIHPAGLL